ncbi:DUF488 domain-containing protein [Rhodococcus globerulus]|uniref:DUF488 domain-containing protein n=1 Tax=Rhodococcus globerulus TaxID=33008 RepID=UPI00052531B4|nr:DUF488 domain-containing protein [Rhodococcus globerulus]PVX59748.1 uncharacterized protein DUF488 [Rhodococcus globerulus]
MRSVVYTVGHSTRPVDQFLDLLLAHGVEQLVDVRTIPKSRHNPQFGQEALDRSLGYREIGYLRLEALGGLRHAVKNTVNGAWRNASFRGYADYMQTDAFSEAVDELCEIAKDRVTVIMCAEAVPWRCHRSMIGDALLVRGYEVLDIMTLTSVKAHTLTSFAKVDGTRIWYPSTDLG